MLRIILTIASFSGSFFIPTILYGQKYKRAAKVNSLQIDSNAKRAIVLKDGLLFGDAGHAVDIEPGISDLVVTAPGHIPRQVIVDIPKDVKKTIVTVNLAKLPKGVDAIDPKFRKIKEVTLARDFRKATSYCKVLNKKGERPTFFVFRCERQTFWEDLRFAKLSFLLAFDDGELSKQDAKLSQDLIDDITQAETDEWYWSAEGLLQRNPGNASTYTLVAHSAFSRQECSRVYEIIRESRLHEIGASQLNIYEGFCREFNNQRKRALKAYMNAVRADVTEGYFHAARMTLFKQNNRTLMTLSQCVKDQTTYYPCYEMLATHHLVNDKKALAKKVIRNYRGHSRKAWTNARKQAADRTLEKRYEVFGQAQLTNLNNFEITWNYVLAAKERNAISTSEIASLIEDLDMTSKKAGEELLSKIESFKNLDYLISTYRAFIRLSPDYPFYWGKLASLYRRRQQCSHAIDAADKALTMKLKARRSIMTIKGDCLMRQGRYDDAANVFLALSRSAPNNWKPFYNLGVVKERQGENAAAIDYFKKSLLRDPPMDIRETLLGKISDQERPSDQ